jgi:voltage-gated potassium channel Kch
MFQVYTSFIMLITIGSIVTWLLESLPACRVIIPGKHDIIRNATKHRLDTFLRYSLPEPYLWYADIIAALVLLTDYILRFIACPVRWRFLVSPLNLADVTGLIPILVMVGMDFYQLTYAVDDTFLHAMYVLNITRVLRVLRMFRVIQHYKPLKVVYWAWKASYRELLLLLIIISVSACVFGSLIYYIELYEDNILTIPHGMWWAIVTMTTVGYGDVVPHTPAGSFMGCLCAITGLLVIAMPIPVIVQNFGRYYDAVQMTSRLTKHQSEDAVKGGEDMKCGEVVKNGDVIKSGEDKKAGDIMKTSNTTTTTSAYNSNRSTSAISLRNKVSPLGGK